MLFRFSTRPTSLSLIFYYIGPALAIITAVLLTGSCSRYCGICGESQWSTIDDRASNLILPSPSTLLSHCRGHKEETWNHHYLCCRQSKRYMYSRRPGQIPTLCHFSYSTRTIYLSYQTTFMLHGISTLPRVTVARA